MCLRLPWALGGRAPLDTGRPGSPGHWEAGLPWTLGSRAPLGTGRPGSPGHWEAGLHNPYAKYTCTRMRWPGRMWELQTDKQSISSPRAHKFYLCALGSRVRVCLSGSLLLLVVMYMYICTPTIHLLQLTRTPQALPLIFCGLPASSVDPTRREKQHGVT